MYYRHFSKMLLLSMAFFYSKILYCQSSVKNDSLLTALKFAKADSIKLKILNALCIESLNNKLSSESKKYGEEYLNLAKQSGNQREEATAYVRIGYACRNMRQFSESNKALVEAIKLYQELEDKENLKILYGKVGYNYFLMENNLESLKYYGLLLKLGEEMLKEAKEEKEKKNAQNTIGNACHSLGTSYLRLSKYQDALKNILIAIKIYEESQDMQGMAECYNSLASVYKYLGDTEAQLKSYMKALEYEKSVTPTFANIYLNISNIYAEQKNYAEATKTLNKFLKIVEEKKVKKYIPTLYLRLGLLYLDQEIYNEAILNFRLSLKASEEIKSKTGVSNAYFHIGELYNKQRNFKDALENFNASLKLDLEQNQVDDISETYSKIASIYLDEKKYSESIKNFQIAIRLDKKANFKEHLALVYLRLGDLYIYMKKFNRARIYMDSSLTISKEIGDKEGLQYAYKYLMRLNMAENNVEGFEESFGLYKKYSDSLYGEANVKLVAEIKEKYEVEKRDNEILKLEGEKQKLENEKQLTALLIKSKGDSLNLVQSEKEKIRLDNERKEAIILYNQQQLALLSKERQLQQLKIDKNLAELFAQKAETDKKQSDFLAQKAETDKKQSDFLAQKAETEKKNSELLLANKAGQLQALEISNQKQVKNYLIAGLVLGMLLSFFVYRNIRTRQQLKLQTLRNKIASDLHDDVGSTLSSISIFSEMAKQQTKEVMPLLDTIGDSSRKMLDAMADIVWTINPENDQFEKIIARMKSFAFELLGAKDIGFEFDADDAIPKMKLPMNVRKNLYLIFKEATNNMVKYSYADKAMFAIKGEKDNLIMIIKDNGKGFDINKATEGNGLKNMKRRASEIGGELMIDTEPGNGTTIQLKLAV